MDRAIMSRSDHGRGRRLNAATEIQLPLPERASNTGEGKSFFVAFTHYSLPVTIGSGTEINFGHNLGHPGTGQRVRRPKYRPSFVN